MLFLSEVTSGSRFRLYALSSDTQQPCHELLTAAQIQMPDEHAKLMARLQRTADHGPPLNQEQCRQLKGDRPEETIYELKTHKLRLFWFYDENRLILCANGIIKGTARKQKQAIDVARSWKTRYLAAKQAGQIQTIASP